MLTVPGFPPLPEVDGGYQLCLADPPWVFSVWSDKGKSRSAENHYDCLPTAKIATLPIRQIMARNSNLLLWSTWPHLEHALSVMNAWGFCTGVGTRILTADLRWVKAETLVIGDRLLAFDERNDQLTRRRYYRFGTVLSTGIINLPCYEIRLADGTEIIASSEHKWLTHTSRAGPEEKMRWIQTDRLSHYLHYHTRKLPFCLPRVAPTVEPDQSYESGFLAAAFDSEGSLSNVKPKLYFSQKNNVLLERVQQYLTQNGYIYSSNTYKESGVSQTYLRGGFSETLRFLMACRPPRLLNRFMEIDCAGSLYCMHWVPIVSVVPIGLHPVVALTTDTGTYIAEGFGAHNTYSSGIPWVKREPDGRPAIGTGYYWRAVSEVLLIGKRRNGKALPRLRHDIPGLLDTLKTGEHSRKPAEVYTLIDQLFGTDLRRIELFARVPHPRGTNWTFWGLEAEPSHHENR